MEATLTSYLIYAALIILIYKIMDRLVRIPKIERPSGRMKNILVTGCDTGFGNLFAKRMASKGFTVFAGCLSEQGVTELHECHLDTLKPFRLNVTDKKSIEEGYEYVISQLKHAEGLWTIVNNAGIVGTSAPFDWLEKEDFNKTLDVNVYGMFMVTKTFIPLVKITRGRIVNTCSIVGRFVLPYSGPYIVSKYAAEALSDGLRRELYPFGVSVHIIEPGFFATRLTDPTLVLGTMTKRWSEIPQNVRDEYGQKFLDGASKVMTDIMPKMGSSNLDLVVDCYEHAMTAKYPRGRYMPGYDSRFGYFVLSLMPEWLSDFLLDAGSRIHVPRPLGCKKYR